MPSFPWDNFLAYPEWTISNIEKLKSRKKLCHAYIFSHQPSTHITFRKDKNGEFISTGRLLWTLPHSTNVNINCVRCYTSYLIKKKNILHRFHGIALVGDFSHTTMSKRRNSKSKTLKGFLKNCVHVISDSSGHLIRVKFQTSHKPGGEEASTCVALTNRGQFSTCEPDFTWLLLTTAFWFNILKRGTVWGKHNNQEQNTTTPSWA